MEGGRHLCVCSLLVSFCYSPTCNIFDEENESYPQAYEANGHGGHNQLLQAAEELLAASLLEAVVTARFITTALKG